ncbi:MAG: dual specificity protein phosphatase family protein [Mariniblastus sp.]|nr:dual specificity protein phosphatase family protein [Mariniblastus sp.]
MSWPVLKAKLLAYPTLGWNMLLGRILKVRNWWDTVDEQVILGAYPFAKDVPQLHEMGVKAVVNTCAEYPGPTEQYHHYDIDQLRVPTVDFTHPSLATIETAVDYMDQEIAKGHKVYVHCKAGRGRSATVVACWLMKNKGLSAQEAQDCMLRKRPQVNPRIMCRPVVQQYEAQLQANQTSEMTS